MRLGFFTGLQGFRIITLMKGVKGSIVCWEIINSLLAEAE
jgi:hypothetical protein